MFRVRLPLYGSAKAAGPLGPLPLRRKALGILYYLALEGPTRRERLADLLWGHGAALQNLRAELTHLRSFLGKEALRGPVLSLPPGVELDRTASGGDPLEGLEDLSPSFADWVQMWRARWGKAEETLPFPERLKGVRPPALVVLIGPPGSGREEVARALSERLSLPFRQGRPQGPGVYYFGEPLPGKELAFALHPAPEQVLVVARSRFGEDPAFLLALRARFPAEITFVEEVPRLSWPEARDGPLRHRPFLEAARFFLRSGGRVEVLRELLSMGSPEALPQRVRAAVALEARYLPLAVRLALEVLSLHPGPWPAELAEALGLQEEVNELEHRGWLAFQGGRYRLTEPQFRPYLAAGFGAGQRAHLHRRLAQAFAGLGDPVAEAYHRHQGGEAVDVGLLGTRLRGWRRAVARPPSVPRVRVGLGRRRILEGLEEVHLVSLGGEGVGVELGLPEPTLLRLRGQVHQELPLGLGASLEAFPLRLRGAEREVSFLPGAVPGHYFWGTVLPEEGMDHLLLLPEGLYFLELRTPGIASFRLEAYAPEEGSAEALAPLGVPVLS